MSAVKALVSTCIISQLPKKLRLLQINQRAFLQSTIPRSYGSKITIKEGTISVYTIFPSPKKPGLKQKNQQTILYRIKTFILRSTGTRLFGRMSAMWRDILLMMYTCITFLPPRKLGSQPVTQVNTVLKLSLIHISEPTRRTPISYAVFCLKKKKK